MNIFKSTSTKKTLSKRGQKKTNLNIWNIDTNGEHSQKGPSDEAVRRVITPFPQDCGTDIDSEGL